MRRGDVGESMVQGMQTSISIGPRVIRFRCANEFLPQAERLESVLRAIGVERGGDFFTPGRTIELGASLLELVEYEGVLEVHEPDFTSDPSVLTHDDLTTTLSIVAQQEDITRPLGVRPVAVSAFDKVKCTEEALRGRDVFMQRVDPSNGNSGWSLALIDDPERDEGCDWIPVHALLRLLPSAARVITLPAGYMAMFPDRELSAIVDPTNDRLYMFR